jgi:AcrR family transcriptional regulator
MPEVPAVEGEDIVQEASEAGLRQGRLPRRPPPRQQRARARREAILVATLELLAEHDPAEITTTLIAQRAGVPVGSIYQYFPNKFGILRELAEGAMLEMDRRLVALMEEIDPEDAARAPVERLIDDTIDAILEIYEGGPRIVRLFQAVRRTPELKGILRGSNERMVSVLQEALRRLRPDLPPLAIEAAARTAVQCYTYLEALAVDYLGRPLQPLLVAEWKRLAHCYFGSVLSQPPAEEERA